jgi:hypothetical protein
MKGLKALPLCFYSDTVTPVHYDKPLNARVCNRNSSLTGARDDFRRVFVTVGLDLVQVFLHFSQVGRFYDDTAIPTACFAEHCC